MLEWAKKELDRIEKDEDGMQEHINKNILELVEVFSKQGHTNFSANYLTKVLQRLLRFQPITPLTGEESEWNDVGERNGESLCQNNRCSTVFRFNKDNSTAYDIDGKVFSDDGGETWFTNNESNVAVEFPYFVPERPEMIILNKEELN